MPPQTDQPTPDTPKPVGSPSIVPSVNILRLLRAPRPNGRSRDACPADGSLMRLDGLAATVALMLSVAFIFC